MFNYDIYVRNVNSPFNTGFSLDQCGITSCHGKCVSIPRIYEKYVLTFVTKGEGNYIINNRKFHVKQGQGFLTSPNMITRWTTSERNPWEFSFIVLSGHEVGNVLNSMGLHEEQNFFDFFMDEKIITLLSTIYDTCKKRPDSALEINGQLYFLLNELQKKIDFSTVINKREIYLKKAIDFIKNNYMYSITIEDITNHAGIDRTYLYKLFVTHENCSPIQYLTKYRLETSKQFLEDDNYSITDVALAVGYFDHSHFSRHFKNNFGISPGKYRRQNRDNAV